MIGLKNIIKDLEAMDTKSLIRIIIFLGSKGGNLEDKSSVAGISSEALNSEALATILWTALCETCDDKGFFPGAVAGKLAK